MSEVAWTDAALDQLANIYVASAAGERNRLVAAVEEIDRRLGGNAPLEGESRGGNSRIYFHDLLVVLFTVAPHSPVMVAGVRPNKRLRK